MSINKVFNKSHKVYATTNIIYPWAILVSAITSTLRVTAHPFIFYLCTAMNHLAVQVCDTRLKVTVLKPGLHRVVMVVSTVASMFLTLFQEQRGKTSDWSSFAGSLP